MASPTLQIGPVLRCFDDRFAPSRIDSLGSAGGYSGARFWRLFTEHATLCLRRWPTGHPNAERLIFIHSVLATVSNAGFKAVPLPIRTRTGATFADDDGHLWELTPWLPGAADFHASPSPVRLTAAMQALATFHRAATRHPLTPTTNEVSPALRERISQLEALRAGRFAELEAAIATTSLPNFDRPARDILHRFSIAAESVFRRLAIAAPRTVPLQPVIRDIWHDHVLFTGDTATGLIDFGAMRVDTVAADVSRLLGSLIGDDRFSWEAGLRAYEVIRPLTPAERELIPVFDETSVLLSGLNWLSWLYLEGRHFDDLSAISKRLVEITGRLDALIRRNPLV